MRDKTVHQRNVDRPAKQTDVPFSIQIAVGHDAGNQAVLAPVQIQIGRDAPQRSDQDHDRRNDPHQRDRLSPHRRASRIARGRPRPKHSSSHHPIGPESGDFDTLARVYIGRFVRLGKTDTFDDQRGRDDTALSSAPRTAPTVDFPTHELLPQRALVAPTLLRPGIGQIILVLALPCQPDPEKRV